MEQCVVQTYSASWDVVELSSGNGGQGDDGGDGEALHFECYSGDKIPLTD
jgi:hypothetical protein